MRNPYGAVRASVLALMALVLLLGHGDSTAAATRAGLTVNIYFQVFDEQNTDGYYGATGYCTGNNPLVGTSYFQGDLANGPTTAYNFPPIWTLSSNIISSGLSSSQYVNGADCVYTGGNCVTANFDKSLSVLNVDTRHSLGPRKVDLNFAVPYSEGGLKAGDPTIFGGSLLTPAMVSIFLNSPYTKMSVCSSTACPEAEPAFARLWFTDPNNVQLTWRVDWSYMRVLRLSSNTWYVLADSCDGGQIASLYKLQNQRNKVTTSLQGYYLIPFFLTATQP